VAGFLLAYHNQQISMRRALMNLVSHKVFSWVNGAMYAPQEYSFMDA